MTTPGSPTASRAYPPVHRLTTRGQFLVFALVMLTIAAAISFPAARGYQGRGFDIQWWHTLALNFLGVGFVLAMARPVWRLLDATPLAPGQRWRNGAARLAAWAGYSILDGTWAHGVTMFIVWLFALDSALLADPENSWTGQILGGAFGFGFLLMAHVVFQRGHERQELLLVERSLAQARLQALSLELQPHFLFNTLNGIAALSRDDPPRAERMLLGLSDLLRLTLESGIDGEIPLRRELEQLDLYLELQGMRFGRRLTVVRDVDPAALEARVPVLLLQPLVENALTHGIGPRPGPGRLELSAQREGGTLVLRVRDDGVGLRPQGLQERTGVGTTRARLAEMFGTGQSFTLRSAAGGGAVAEIRIPFTQATSDESAPGRTG